MESNISSLTWLSDLLLSLVSPSLQSTYVGFLVSLNRSVTLQPHGLYILFALSGLLCPYKSTRLTFSLCSSVCSCFILPKRPFSAALYKIRHFMAFSVFLNNFIFLHNTYCIACYLLRFCALCLKCKILKTVICFTQRFTPVLNTVMSEIILCSTYMKLLNNQNGYLENINYHN